MTARLVRDAWRAGHRVALRHDYRKPRDENAAGACSCGFRTLIKAAKDAYTDVLEHAVEVLDKPTQPKRVRTRRPDGTRIYAYQIPLPTESKSQ